MCCSGLDSRRLRAVAQLADDRQYIRQKLPELGLCAFVADGSILPRGAFQTDIGAVDGGVLGNRSGQGPQSGLQGVHAAEQQYVLSHLLEDGDMTLYGLANAVTRYAQDVDSYDRAIQLESAGYDLITMPLHQWNHFNQAAAPQAAA